MRYQVFMKSKGTTSSLSVFSLQSFTQLDQLSSINLRSVSSVKSGARASKKPTSGELFNADSMALQPTFDPRLININREIDLFRSMMNKTSREAEILIYKDLEYYSYQIQRQFLWELCLDVSVLFKRYGWAKAFVRPLDDGCEDFGSGDRILFPEARSTHCVIALPKAGRQAFDVWQKKVIDWGREDSFYFEKLCGSSSDGEDEQRSIGEFYWRDLVVCQINEKLSVLKREDCDFFLKQEEECGTRASKESISGELLHANSMALQPSTFDARLININTEIDIFRSMMNKTSREGSILNDKAPEYHSYQLQRQFFWELCLDVCPLFERYGWRKAFVSPLNYGYKGFGSGDRVLFPEGKSTHCVIALPKAGRQAFDVRRRERIEWGREDNFHFESLCAYREDREDGKISIAELSPRDILVCQINEERYLLKREDCDLFLKEEEEYRTKREDPYSEEWWEYIPDEEPRDVLTGLYITPPLYSHVSICKDYGLLEPWMREEGVFAVVLSIQPPPTITPHDENDQPLLGKDGKEVRIPGIPLVEIAFPEDEYEGGRFLPADHLKVREEDEDQEAEDKEEQDVEDDESEENE